MDRITAIKSKPSSGCKISGAESKIMEREVEIAMIRYEIMDNIYKEVQFSINAEVTFRQLIRTVEWQTSKEEILKNWVRWSFQAANESYDNGCLVNEQDHSKAVLQVDRHVDAWTGESNPQWCCEILHSAASTHRLEQYANIQGLLPNISAFKHKDLKSYHGLVDLFLFNTFPAGPRMQKALQSDVKCMTGIKIITLEGLWRVRYLMEREAFEMERNGPGYSDTATGHDLLRLKDWVDESLQAERMYQILPVDSHHVKNCSIKRRIEEVDDDFVVPLFPYLYLNFVEDEQDSFVQRRCNRDGTKETAIMSMRVGDASIMPWQYEPPIEEVYLTIHPFNNLLSSTYGVRKWKEGKPHMPLTSAYLDEWLKVAEEVLLMLDGVYPSWYRSYTRHDEAEFPRPPNPLLYNMRTRQMQVKFLDYHNLEQPLILDDALKAKAHLYVHHSGSDVTSTSVVDIPVTVFKREEDVKGTSSSSAPSNDVRRSQRVKRKYATNTDKPLPDEMARKQKANEGRKVQITKIRHDCSNCKKQKQQQFESMPHEIFDSLTHKDICLCDSITLEKPELDKTAIVDLLKGKSHNDLIRESERIYMNLHHLRNLMTAIYWVYREEARKNRKEGEKICRIDSRVNNWFRKDPKELEPIHQSVEVMSLRFDTIKEVLSSRGSFSEQVAYQLDPHYDLGVAFKDVRTIPEIFSYDK
jgi:hypothetical protein